MSSKEATIPPPQNALERLERACRARPDNLGLVEELLRARARVRGSSAYFLALRDLRTWDGVEPVTQDQAIAAVAEALPSVFLFDETRVFSCADQTHRIGVFRLQGIDQILHLIPGTRSLSPFLMGAVPVIEEDLGIPGGRRDLIHAPYLDPEQIFQWQERQSLPLRLPSEEEWVHACRAGSTSLYYWGDRVDRSYCWFQLNSQRRRHSVLEHIHKTNGFGLIDMLGQAWELCTHQPHVFIGRGGSYLSPAHDVTCESRREGRMHRLRGFGVRWCAEIPGAADR